jgi:uncharacterized protein YbjT (DUF2867 family)
MDSVLVAGATGALGRQVVAELKQRGYNVRRLVRSNPEPGDHVADLRDASAVRDACRGMHAVISCAGASMSLTNWSDRAGFREVDWLGNRNLLEDAKRHEVRKFVYVSLNDGPSLVHTDYAKYHEAFVDDLKRSGIPFTVVRPTGLFSFYLEILNMARKGTVLLINKGWPETNPIHEADAARACIEALILSRPDFAIGGPEIRSRKRITEMAFEALGKTPSTFSLPGKAFLPLAAAMGFINPRIGALAQFGIAVSSANCIGPLYGMRTLDAYFRQHV